MTHRDEDPKVPAIGKGLMRSPSTDAAAEADALASVGGAETVRGIDRTEATAAADGIAPTDGDFAIAAALRAGEVDSLAALERIVDDVIRVRFAGHASAELRASLLEAFAADPHVASLLAPD